jgi:hypothetical protein
MSSYLHVSTPVLGGQSRASHRGVIKLGQQINKSKEGRKMKAGLLGTKDNPVCAKAAPPRACTAGVRNTLRGFRGLRPVKTAWWLGIDIVAWSAEALG